LYREKENKGSPKEPIKIIINQQLYVFTMAELGIRAGQSYCYYCRSILLNKEEKNQGHHNTCKYEISQYKEELGYWYYLQMVNATTDDCLTDVDGRIIKLDLSRKGLADLPNLPFKDIEELDVSGNLLDRIPQWIFDLPQLKKMSFPGNGFSQSLILDMLKLNEKGVIIESTGLKFFNNILLSVNLAYIGSFMRTDPLDFSEEILEYFSTIKNVNIAYNALDHLPEWIFQITGIEEINIAGNYLSADEFKKLIDLQNLQRLKISSNTISPEVEEVVSELEEKGILVTHYEPRYW
jgi:hypothetical protein